MQRESQKEKKQKSTFAYLCRTSNKEKAERKQLWSGEFITHQKRANWLNLPFWKAKQDLLCFPQTKILKSGRKPWWISPLWALQVENSLLRGNIWIWRSQLSWTSRVDVGDGSPLPEMQISHCLLQKGNKSIPRAALGGFSLSSHKDTALG